MEMIIWFLFIWYYFIATMFFVAFAKGVFSLQITKRDTGEKVELSNLMKFIIAFLLSIGWIYTILRFKEDFKQ